MFVQPAAAKGPLKVGFVYFSPVFDTGWTFEHDKGRKQMESVLGNKVKSTIVENVANDVYTFFAKSKSAYLASKGKVYLSNHS